MLHRECKTNQVYISGKIISGFTFSHEVAGEGFYQTEIAVGRTSGTKDILPLMISERLMDVTEACVGETVGVTGQFRSGNEVADGKRRLRLYVFALDYVFREAAENTADANDIVLEGHICKTPIYRRTPLNRQITDLLLAVNRPYGKSDYIPCIVWGRNALYASGLDVGSKVRIRGRVQSREYEKQAGGVTETRRAYEVSVSSIDEEEEPPREKMEHEK